MAPSVQSRSGKGLGVRLSSGCGVVSLNTLRDFLLWVWLVGTPVCETICFVFLSLSCLKTLSRFLKYQYYQLVFVVKISYQQSSHLFSWL